MQHLENVLDFISPTKANPNISRKASECLITSKRAQADFESQESNLFAQWNNRSLD
jgi:hypothetical protein